MTHGARSKSRGLLASALVAVLAGCPCRVAAAEVDFHGTLDVTGVLQDDGIPLNLLMYGDTMFDPYRARLHADIAASDVLRVYTQFVVTDANSADIRPYGAYLSWAPNAERDLQVVAGKIPWFIGTYGPRTYSDKKPLIGTPLMYQYRSTLRSDRIPPNADALLAAAGTGQYGPVYDASGRGYKGMPVLYDACWSMGAMVVGSASGFEYSGGVTQGPPSAPAAGPDGNSAKNLLGRLGWSPHPALRVGVSGSYGGYMNRSFESQIPPDQDVNDYRQRIVMADLQITGARAELIAEAFANRWNTPTVGNLDNWGGYVEGKYGFDFGGWLAGRYEWMNFDEIADSGGTLHTWDANIFRYEVGGGYRFTKAVQAKFVYQHNQMDEDRVTRVPPEADVLAGQVIVSW